MEQAFSSVDQHSEFNWHEAGSLEANDFGLEPLDALIQPVRHVTDKNLCHLTDLTTE